ncbi:hypothetical protein CR513_50385, partial [Mucuna pruriens]
MLIIDSDATLHVTPRKKFFTSYTSDDFGVLKMDNDGVTKVIGVDDVCLQTNMGVQLWLRGVKHASDIRFNLISVHMLDDRGYDNHFGYENGNSPKIWVHDLKTKNQVLEKFKQSHALVERQSGKKAFVHVPKDERSKLDMKTRQCIFIGYDQDEYGYKLYDLVEKKIFRSHDM